MGLVNWAKPTHAVRMYWLITVINASHQISASDFTSNLLIVLPPPGWLSCSLPKCVVIGCNCDCWLDGFWCCDPPKWPTAVSDGKWGAMWEVGQTAECQCLLQWWRNCWSTHMHTHIVVDMALTHFPLVPLCLRLGFPPCDAAQPQVACCFVPLSYWRHLT